MPASSRWASHAWTAGDHEPALRRTLSPMRRTLAVWKPSVSGSSRPSFIVCIPTMIACH